MMIRRIDQWMRRRMSAEQWLIVWSFFTGGFLVQVIIQPRALLKIIFSGLTLCAVLLAYSALQKRVQ